VSTMSKDKINKISRYSIFEAFNWCCFDFALIVTGNYRSCKNHWLELLSQFRQNKCTVELELDFMEKAGK